MFAPKQGLSSIKVDCCSTVGHVVAYDDKKGGNFEKGWMIFPKNIQSSY